MDLELILRPHRKALVVAAEATIHGTTSEPPQKSQFNQLISICGQATCPEEINNYLRYQAHRTRGPWNREFVEATIRGIAPVLQGIDMDPHTTIDRIKVAAWRLYAVFLMRTFTYAKPPKKGNGHVGTR